MTDKDIIKAFKCCTNGYCENCPFFPTREHCHSLDSLILDLINRQQAEIFKLQAKNEALEMDNKQLDRDVFNALMNLETAQAEIERLKENEETVIREFRVVNADKERILLIAAELSSKLKTAKAEAVKEAFHKLRLRMGNCDLPKGIVRSQMEHIEKEMVGDSNV